MAEPPTTDLVPEAAPEEELDRYGRGLDHLTGKQRLFVEEYTIDWNGTQAAIRAGYSPNAAKDQAYENLRKPHIVEAIAKVMAARSEATRIDRAWVLANLAREHRNILEDKSVAARRDRIRIIELIGKHVDVAAFRTQVGFAGPDGGPIDLKWNLSILSDEELDLFERLLAKISPSVGDPSREGEEDQGEGPGEDQERP